MKFKFAAAAVAAAFAFTSLSASAAEIPVQKTDPALNARLPAAVKEAGVIKNCVIGSFSPYTITRADKSIEGAAMDITKALGEVLGVKIETTKIAGHSATMLGLKSGRFDVSIEPVGDYPDREANYDFIDYVREFVVFAVKKGNPKNIQSLADTCGLKVSVMAAGSAERVIKEQSKVCVKEGRKPVTVLSFEGQAAPAMALTSGRADAFFSSQAPLTYFVSQSGGKLELAAVGKKNGFSDIWQGAVVMKGNPLGPVLLDGMKVLFENGTYKAVMEKWNLGYNQLEAPGMNLATAKKN